MSHKSVASGDGAPGVGIVGSGYVGCLARARFRGDSAVLA